MQTPSNFLNGHEQFVYRYDRSTGLRALIAVHDTTLGPGLGGVRLWRYDTVEDAITDVLRLSEGMTYKAAVAGLPLGGGKSVMMADGKETDSVLRAERFEVFGSYVEELGGRYIAAEDVGTKPADMVVMRKSTRYVTGLPPDQGGSGDPSPMTAFGVLQGIRALVEDVMQKDNLEGVRFAIQGLGKVGFGLAMLLLEEGAVVTGSDVNEAARERAREAGIKLVAPEEIHRVDCDVFSPCALGAVINDSTIHDLTCKIIAGAANNQLAQARHGEALHEKGIIYGVDYVLNAGGLINVAAETEGYDPAKARANTANIYHTVRRMLETSRMEGISTVKAADRMAREALGAVPA